MGFVESMQAHPNGAPKNFHDWALRTFGTGIAKHFMLPYNEKFWKQDLRTITCGLGQLVDSETDPRRSRQRALVDQQGHGLQPQVHLSEERRYRLPAAGAGATSIRIHPERIRWIHRPKRKVVRLAGGREEAYDSLVSTLPLPLRFRMLKRHPDTLQAGMRGNYARYRCLNINIGIDRPTSATSTGSTSPKTSSSSRGLVFP